MTQSDKAFTGSIPVFYDRYLGPLLQHYRSLCDGRAENRRCDRVNGSDVQEAISPPVNSGFQLRREANSVASTGPRCAASR